MFQAKFDRGDSVEQMPGQGCSLLLPSLVAVTQEALSFHYPAFPRLRLSQAEVYGNTAAESSPAPQLYESVEHAANITPCNTLPRHICP